MSCDKDPNKTTKISPWLVECKILHYNDVIMTTIASQITSLTVVYSTVDSDTDQRKYQSSALLAFVWGIHRDRGIPRTQGQLRGKCFHLMTSSWQYVGEHVNMTYGIDLTCVMRGNNQQSQASKDMPFINGVIECSRCENIYSLN